MDIANADLTQLTLVAFIVEALIHTLKPAYDPDKGWNKDALFALIVGVLVCSLTNVDLFSAVGLNIQIPYVGAALTGILASRGSNVVHDIFKFVQEKSISGEGGEAPGLVG
jgi:hypothetical protein